MAAPSASPISKVQQGAAVARASQPSRQSQPATSFAEALEAQERQLGEPERDSRVSRARQQRRPAADPGETNTAIEAARPQSVSGQPVKEPDDKMKETAKPAGEGSGEAAQGETATCEKPAEPVVTVEAKVTEVAAQTTQAEPAAVPVQAPAPAVAESAAAASPEGIVAIDAADGPDARTASPQAATDASVADVAPVPETGAKPDASKAAATLPAQSAVVDADKPAAKEASAEPVAPPSAKTEVADKVAAKADVRSAEPGAAASSESAARPAAAETAQAQPATQPSTPQTPTAAASPTSFAAEVAQKVAAQTNSAGSVVPVHALAVTIAARANAGTTRFDIRLDPAELGRIDVQLTIDREGRVKSKLVVEKQETLDLLQRDQRNLERALSQAGVQTGDNSLEFSLKDQGSQNARDRQAEDGSHPRQVVIEDPDTVAALQASAATYARAAAMRGGVDIRI
ncbi:MAG: flagellar hook-length control protein FliK [Phreatobacter sp.]|nr:flagellar hook-length control protein FliK [Phreatobacter sp.]